MNNTRIEILKDGIWVYLELGQDKSIRYNSVINKIGKTSTREISGSNTFSIPWTFHNVQTLGLNQFNATELAASLNQKYEAKYYNEDTLFQEGFVVINNMDSGPININFIDEALFITEKWGATSYNDLLKDSSLQISAVYQTAIDEMVNYDIDKSAVLAHLTNISGETFPLALFPNNLNQIGDKWQIFGDGTDHKNNGINPYQSRPIFNAKAFITLACEAYGYDPIFHTSIDWATVAKTYMVTKGLEKSQYGDSGIITVNHPRVTEEAPHYLVNPGGFGVYESQVSMEFAFGTGIVPATLTGFPASPLGLLRTGPGDGVWRQRRNIFVPNVSGGNVGTIRFTATVENDGSGSGANDGTFIIYKHKTTANTYIIEEAVVDTENNSTTTVDYTMDKTQFNTPTSSDAGDVIGIYLLRYDVTNSSSGSSMTNMDVVETYSPAGLISYDKHGQYLQDAVDLTYAASTETISSLIKGLMQKDGMLMNIDSKRKEIEFFAYSAYGTRRDLGGDNIVDWSKYLLEYSNPKFNTNYGNNYAISNKVGLSGPYPGNSVKIILGNQTSSSKYKDSAEDYNSTFKDVVSAQKLLYSTTPYVEYKVSGNSLVELDVNLGNLEQYRYDSTTSSLGTLTGLPAIYNVNFSVATGGINAWYGLIDNSVRAKPSFLLPLDVVKNLDLRKPIFISQLGGYYIPEEVEQYIDSKTPVSVKLIKLNIS
tara:strand:- start:257 stop:2383 length:2127 start_codon:yes stop_codon:yes gene_type:complete